MSYQNIVIIKALLYAESKYFSYNPAHYMLLLLVWSPRDLDFTHLLE